MTLRTLRKSFLPAVALALAVACGGGKTAGPGPVPTGSTGLVYKDPTGGLWNLVKNASSTRTHVVLDLVGPAGLKARGIGFNLQSDGTAPFSKLTSAGYVQDLGVFKLQSTFANYPVEPTLLAGGVKKNGTLLTVGDFQKDRTWPAQAMGQPVLQIAFDFDPVKTAALPPGTVLPLAITKAKYVPDDIGTMPADPASATADWSSVYYAFSASIVPAQISVGTLTTE